MSNRKMDELISESETASWLRLHRAHSVCGFHARNFGRNEKTKRVSIMLTCSSILILLPLISEAHSNINSVWLSKDDSQQQNAAEIKYHITKSSAIKQTQNETAPLLSPSASNQVSFQSAQPDNPIFKQLQASSSSLQPAIASLDQESERRSDTESAGAAPLAFAPGISDFQAGGVSARSPVPQLGTFNNEASSLDTLWSVNQTNAQVQFDEEHAGSNQQERAHRRQDNETSTLAPKHEIPAPISRGEADPSDLSPDLHIGQELDLNEGGKVNSSQQNNQPALDVHILSAASFNNQSQPTTNHSTTNQQQSSVIYYMPEGYKWYPTSNDAQASGSRRKLHTSGTQYDLNDARDKTNHISSKSTSPPLLTGEIQSQTSDQFAAANQLDDSLGSDASKVQAGGGLAHEFYQISNYAQQNKLQNRPLTYGFVPAQTQITQQQPVKFIRTTQAPAQQQTHTYIRTNTLYKPLPVYPSSLSQDYQQQHNHQLAASTNNNLFLHNNHLQPHLGYAQQQTIVRPRLVPRPPRYPSNYQFIQQFQAHQQPLSQWPVGSRRDTTGWRTQRPIIGPITVNRLRHPHEHSNKRKNLRQASTGKPSAGKKSFLGAIGSRLTSWVEPITSSSGSSGNRVKDPEESFYEAGRSNKRLPLASAHWSPANFYLLDASQHEPAMLTNLVHPPSPLHHRGALAYYPTPLYGHQVRQPTVAPAASSLDKFYSADTSGLHNPLQAPHNLLPDHMYLRGQRRRRYPTVRVQADSQGRKPPMLGVDPTGVVQQQPASFIPVVAVSVTKTSPAPRPASDSTQGDKAADSGNSELYDYLELKTGAGNKNQGQDDYGNMASGSVNRDTGLLQSYPTKALPTQRPAHLPNDQLTTTVKSAIFGYLPHEANKPLMDALSAVPHYATRAQLASEALHGHPPLTLADVDRNPLLHQASGSDLSLLDEQPSLGLQLQANNFAQNDIAHPFAASSQNQLKTYHSAAATSSRSSVANRLPLSAVYPASQAQYHGFQFFQPSDSAQHPQVLTAAAAELNPLLMPVMFAGPQQQAASFGSAKSQYALLSPAQGGPSGGPSSQEQQESGDQSASSSTSNADVADSEDSDSSQGLNKGNKKRSSEFFASAGQILLNALPLLLAPATLGLMFASAPLPVARYHAPTDSFGGGASSFQSGIPGNYLSSLNQGQVMNSSPVQLFTPSPPAVYNSSVPNGTSGSTTTAKPTSPLASPSATSATVTAPSQPPARPGANSQQLAPGVVKASSLGNRTSQNGYGPQRITVTLTTPSYANESDLLATDNGEGSDPKAPHISANTLLLLTHDDEGDPSESERNRTLAGGEQPIHYSSTNHGHVGGHEQQAGYDGVDFDAQYPSLRKSSLATSGVKLLDQNQNQSQNQRSNAYPGNSTRYSSNQAAISQLIRKPSAQNRDTAQQASSPERDQELDPTAGNKLYPMSTFPALRRRTVSLVTSNGNKTLLDASEKYQNIDYFSDGPARLKPQQPLVAAPALLAQRNSTPTNEPVHYPETNFDDSEDDSVSAPVKAHGSSKSQSQVHQAADSAPMDFLFSNGLATVSMTSEPLTARRARSKRDVGAADGTKPKRRLVKKVRRIVHLRREAPKLPSNESAAIAQDQVQVASNSSNLFAERSPAASPGDVPAPERTDSNGGADVLRAGASSGKSAHVIAAMVAHLDNEEEEAAARRRRANRDFNGGDDFRPISGDPRPERPDTLSNNELRELLSRKKVTRSATSGGNKSLDQVGQVDSDQDYETNQQVDGQGPFGEAGEPMEVTRFRLSANGATVKSKQRVGSSNATQRRPDGTSGVELNEDTKKALANIGSVLIREGLAIGSNEQADQSDSQIERPAKRRQTKRSRQRHDSSDENWRQRRFRQPQVQQVRDDQEDLGAVATERNLFRATPATLSDSDPDPLGSLDEDNLDGPITLDARDALIDRPGRKTSESVKAYQVAHGRSRSRLRESPNMQRDEYEGPSLFIRDDDLAAMRQRHTRGRNGSVVRDHVSLFENSSGRPNAFGASDDRPDLQDEYHSSRYANTAPIGDYPQHNRSAAADWNSYKSEPNNVGLYPGQRLDGPFRPATNLTDRRASEYAGNEQQPGYYPQGYSQVQRHPENHEPRYQLEQHHREQSQFNQAGMHYQPTAGYSSPEHELYSHHHQQHQHNTTGPHLYAPAYLSQRAPPGPYRPQSSNDYPMVSNNGYSTNNRPEQNYSPIYPSPQQHPPMPIPQRHNGQTYSDHRYPGQDSYSRKFYPPPTKYPASAWPQNQLADQSQPMYNHPAQQQHQASQVQAQQPMVGGLMQQAGPLAVMSSHDRSDSRAVNEYFKRAQFSDSDRDKLMASYLTCDGLLNDNDHCLERLSCEFSDPQNIEKANKLDRAVSSILLGHILINTYIPNQFKLRLKSASLFGYTQSGKCNRYVCNKLTRGARES